MRSRTFLLHSIGWGVVLWLIGYVLGIVLFMAVPPSIIGWVISPIGATATLWVLLKRIPEYPMRYYFYLAMSWMLIAIGFDYFFLVKLFKPADGYYKLDVYLYYFLTFTLPLLVGWVRNRYN